MRSIFACLSLILLLSPVMIAGLKAQPRLPQSRPIYFTRLSVSDGLSSEAITSILQDKKGFIWIGTQGGLDRYDGKHIRSYKAEGAGDNVLSDAFVVSLYEDRDANLWIGTLSGHLNRYDPILDRIQSFYLPHDSTFKGNNQFGIRTIIEDDHGILWIGTVNQGLFHFNPQTQTFRRYFLHSDKNRYTSINALLVPVSNSNLLWVGSSDGLSRVDLRNHEIKHFHHDEKDPHSIGPGSVSAVIEDKHGQLWMGTTRAGLNKFNPQTQQFKHYGYVPDDEYSLSDNEITSIIEGHDERLWIGTREAGLNIFDPNRESFERHINNPTNGRSLSNNRVEILYRDRNDVIWIGTFVDLNIYTPLQIAFEAYRSDVGNRGLSKPNVRSLYEDHTGKIWIGLDGALNSFDVKTGQFEYFPNIAGENHIMIIDIFEDSIGNFWLGTTDNKLYRFDKENNLFESFNLNLDLHPPESDFIIQALHESPEEPGVLWIGTNRAGLIRYDTLQKRIERFHTIAGDTTSLSHPFIWRIFEDSRNTLWICTMGGGLNRFDRASREFTRYRHDSNNEHTISSDRVISIYEDSLGTFWVGTFDKGFNKFDSSTGRFRRYTPAQYELPDSGVGNILPDPIGNLWLTSNNGVSKFNPRTGRFTIYGIHDGLHSNTIYHQAGLRSRAGALYFGGKNGFTVLHPSNLNDNPFPPSVVLTDFLLLYESDRYESVRLDTSISFIKEIRRPHDQNFVSFKFAALDYTNPSKNRYEYMLENWDRDWVTAGNEQVATYPNLPPGKYRFSVRGYNNDGVPSNGSTSVDLTITPPFYEQWWFRSLTLFLALGLFYSGYQHRIGQIKKIERTRHRIANDLHDDIGSKISNVALQIEWTGRSQNTPILIRDQLSDIAAYTRNLVDEMRDVVWLIDADYDNISQLIARMKLVAYQMLQGYKYKIRTPDMLPDISLNMHFRRNIYLIFKEALHNFVRHAKSECITIEMQVQQGVFSLSMEDDGRGFDPAHVQLGQGLRSMRERANSMNATLLIHSEPGYGTAISLRLDIV